MACRQCQLMHVGPLSTSGVTRNSRPLDKYPSRALPPLSLLSLSLLLHLPYLTFPSIPTPSRPPIPSPSSPLYSQPFPSASLLLPPHYNGQGIWGSAIAPQRVRTEPGHQTHFCAIHSPKSADLLNYFFIICLELGGPLDIAHPADPTATPLMSMRLSRRR